MSTETQTPNHVHAFAAEHGITLALRSLGQRQDHDGWIHNRFSATLTRTVDGEVRKVSTAYRTGTGWDRRPDVADVLDSLRSDSAAAENARDFRDFCADFGYETVEAADRRKAERVYYACADMRDRMRDFLGAETFEAYMALEGL